MTSKKVTKKVIKKVVKKVKPKEEIIPEVETLETLPVIEEDSITVSEFEEVIGVNSAESLQKAGRQLIAVSIVNGTKVYKFKR
jgi:hypothetical protein